MSWLLLLGPLVSPLVSLAKNALIGAVSPGAAEAVRNWTPAINAGIQVVGAIAANYVGPAVIAAVTGGDPSATIVSNYPAYEAAVIGIVNAGTGMASYELWSRYAE